MMHNLLEKLTRRACLVIMATIIVLIPNQGWPADPNKAIDLRADTLRVEGSEKTTEVLEGVVWVKKATVTEGKVVNLICEWSANLVPSYKNWETKVEQKFPIYIAGLISGHGVIPAGTTMGIFDKGTNYAGSHSSYKTGNQVKGTKSLKWDSGKSKPGLHKVECVIPKTGFVEPDLLNNVTSVYVEVLPKTTVSVTGGGAVMPTAAAPKGLPDIMPGQPKTKVSDTGSPAVMPTDVAPKGLPDVLPGRKMMIAGQTVTSHGLITVDAKNATRVVNNQCEFSVQYTVMNSGMLPTGGFSSTFKNSASTQSVSRTWMSIAPGGTVPQTDFVQLRPGSNIVQLTVDSASEVTESNETNNGFQFVATLNGSCGPERIGVTAPPIGRTPPAPVRTVPESPVRTIPQPPTRSR